MDIAEVAIKVQAFAEGAIEMIAATRDEMQGMAKDMSEVNGKKLRVDVDTKSSGEVRSIAQGVQSVGSELNKIQGKKLDLNTGGVVAQMRRVAAEIKAAEENYNSLLTARNKDAAAIQNQADLVSVTKEEYRALAEYVVETGNAGGKASAQFQLLVSQYERQSAAIQKLKDQMREKGIDWAPSEADLAKLAEMEAKLDVTAAKIHETAGGMLEVGTATAAATVSTEVWSIALTYAEKVIKRMKTTLVSMGAGLIMGAVIGGVTKLIEGFTKAREEAERLRQEQLKANEEAIRDSLKTAESHQQSANNIRSMGEEYATLARKRRTASEDARFLELENDLATAMGVTNEAIRSQVKSIETWAEAMNKASGGATEKSLQAMRDANKLQRERIDLKNQELTASYEAITPTSGYAAHRPVEMLFDKAEIVAARESAQEEWRTQAEMLFDTMLIDMEQNGEKFSEGAAQILKDSLINSLVLAGDYTGSEAQTAWLDNFIETQLNGMRDILSSADVASALEGYGGIVDQIFFGEIGAEEGAARIAAQFDVIEAAITAALTATGMEAGKAEEKAKAFLSTLTGGKEISEFAANVEASGRSAALAAAGFDDLAKKQKEVDDSIGKARNLTNHVKDAENAVTAYKKLNKEMQNNPAEIAKVNSAVGKLGMAFDGTDRSLKDAEKGLENFKGSLADQAEALEADIFRMEADFAALGDAAYINGVLTADASNLLAAIAISKKELADLIAAMKEAGVDVKTGKGGGSKKSTPTTSTSSGPSAYEKAMEEIRHLKALDQLTYEQELRHLEDIGRKYKLNAKERRQLEEDIYAVKKQIAERDAADIDQMAQGIKDALAARYEAMQEAELTRLDESRKAWEQWRDDSVKAINDQIAALDKLSQTEDREKKDAEELRKIAKLRQDVEFEQDDYNRRKLQQQLDQAIAAREERLRKQALDDQKAALREEITAIQEKASQQISALDEEQSAIEQAYAERLKSASLQAEAERMIMANNQDEIIALLGEYAPEYDALGKTLGEKLLDGFQKKVGSVIDWFKSLNDTLYNIQQNAASQAIAAADAFAAGQASRTAAGASTAPVVTVEQNNVFTVPVESPADTARKLREANEALGAEIAAAL